MNKTRVKHYKYQIFKYLQTTFLNGTQTSIDKNNEEPVIRTTWQHGSVQRNLGQSQEYSINL